MCMAKRTVITNGIIGSLLLVLAFFAFNLNTNQTYLSITAPLYNGSRDTNKVAFMFIVDSTAAANNLPPIFQALTDAQAQATFFVSGASAVNNLATIQQIATQFELGNYGFSNTNLNIADKNLISEEISVCDSLIHALTGQKMRLFTPPDCLYNKNTLGIAANLGYQTVLPTVRKVAIDWDNTDSNLVAAYATYDTKAGDIILLRPTTATTQCISKIIASFMQRDLVVTSVGDLLARPA